MLHALVSSQMQSKSDFFRDANLPRDGFHLGCIDATISEHHVEVFMTWYDGGLVTRLALLAALMRLSVSTMSRSL